MHLCLPGSVPALLASALFRWPRSISIHLSPATKSALRGSQRAAPATKSVLRGSQSAVRATKSAHRGSQSAVTVRKSALRGSQSAVPATKSALRGHKVLCLARNPQTGHMSKSHESLHSSRNQSASMPFEVKHSDPLRLSRKADFGPPKHEVFLQCARHHNESALATSTRSSHPDFASVRSRNAF